MEEIKLCNKKGENAKPSGHVGGCDKKKSNLTLLG